MPMYDYQDFFRSDNMPTSSTTISGYNSMGLASPILAEHGRRQSVVKDGEKKVEPATTSASPPSFQPMAPPPFVLVNAKKLESMTNTDIVRRKSTTLFGRSNNNNDDENHLSYCAQNDNGILRSVRVLLTQPSPPKVTKGLDQRPSTNTLPSTNKTFIASRPSLILRSYSPTETSSQVCRPKTSSHMHLLHRRMQEKQPLDKKKSLGLVIHKKCSAAKFGSTTSSKRTTTSKSVNRIPHHHSKNLLVS